MLVYKREITTLMYGEECVKLVSSKRGRLFRRKDGKYLIYIAKDLAEDSQFPFSTETSMRVKISFAPGVRKLIVEPHES